MVMKIDRDASRFKQIVRGKIRENLRKYVTHGEMIGRKGRDLVSIPLPQLDVPHFRYGQNGSGGVGQGDGEVGQPIGRRRSRRRRPGPGRQRAGRSTSWKSKSRSKSWPRSWATNWSCRASSPRARRTSTQDKVRYTSIRRIGPESLRHFKRTYVRGPASGRSPTAPTTRPIRASCRSARTSRYRSWEHVPEPEANAVDHLHDGRLRLDDRRAEGDRPHRGVLDRHLAQQPVRRRRAALHHPRRGGQGSRRAHVLPHPRKRRHADQLGLQGLRRS